MVHNERLLENLSLILVNSSDTMINVNSANYYYLSTIINLNDKRSLFNAIHAARSLQVTDENIVTLAEHYSGLEGARGLEILVAEDNKVNQQVIQGILRRAGHEVRIASSGDEVLDLLEDNIDSVDMLILDMNMPEMSGIEVVKTVRFMDASHSMPIIMLTADATPEAREACIEAGANAFLTKPVDTRALLERIADLSQKMRPKLREVPSKVPPPASSQPEELVESEWYDDVALREIMNLGDQEFIESLIASFQRDGEKTVARIKLAAEDDYPEYREALHALKGSSVELGARKLADMCQQAEALKPYDIGSERCKKIAAEIGRTFQLTSAALSNVTSQDIARS